MVEDSFHLRNESLTPIRSAIIASKVSDDAIVSFSHDSDGDISKVRIKFTTSVMNECDFLISEQGFSIVPQSGESEYIELYNSV